MPNIARKGQPDRIVEDSSISTAASCPPSAGDAEQDNMDSMKQFVEQYLQTRGFELTSRNARMVVATLATASGITDWRALEQHVDGELDRERLRPAA